MKKSKNNDFWHGNIKYEDYEAEIKDPADVKKMILRGSVLNQIFYKVKLSYLATFFMLAT